MKNPPRSSAWLGVLVTACLWIALGATRLAAQTTSTPPAEAKPDAATPQATIARALAAIGGTPAYRAAANAHFEFDAEDASAAQKPGALVTVDCRADGARRVVRRFGDKTFTQGYIDGLYWQQHPRTGQVMVMSESDRAAVDLDRELATLLCDYEKFDRRVESIGRGHWRTLQLDRVRFDRTGKPAARTTTPAGESTDGKPTRGDQPTKPNTSGAPAVKHRSLSSPAQLTLGFDAKTGLPATVEYEMKSPTSDRSLRCVQVLSDYRAIQTPSGPIRLPHLVQWLVGEREILRLRIRKVKIGGEFPDTLFQPK